MWKTIGHQKAVNTLTRGQNEGRISHAYLVTGPPQVGKMTFALDIARMVNCVGDSPPCGSCLQCQRVDDHLHADVRVVDLQPREGDKATRTVIGIDQVREVQKEVSLKPFEGKYRVLIFDGAERLSDEASNSLLKTLEEPPEQVVIVLLASDADAMLPTIVSRCQRIELKPLPVPEIVRALQERYDADEQSATELARLSRGRIGWAFQALDDPEIMEQHRRSIERLEDLVGSGLEGRFAYAGELANEFARNRDAVRHRLDLWTEWWRDALTLNEGISQYVTNLSRVDAIRAALESFTSIEIVGAINAIRESIDLLDRNVNPRLVLEQLMLAMPRSAALANSDQE